MAGAGPSLSRHLGGWFTDIDGTVRVRIPLRDPHRVTIRIRHGDIRVFYETRSATRRGRRSWICKLERAAFFCRSNKKGNQS
jgi:hypothetical protein